MKDLQIKCKNKSEKNAALCLLFAHGYKYIEVDNMPDMLKEHGSDVDDMTYKNVLLQWCEIEEEYQIDMCSDSYHLEDDTEIYKFTELTAILKFLTKEPKTETVKISKDYEAVVTEEHIQVGCQTISFEDFDKLSEAVERIRG